MAPKKPKSPLNADKVTKTQASPKSARGRKFGNIMNETNFKLLWAYLEKTPVDHKSVAKRMGMTYAATNQRYYSLRDYFKQTPPFDQPAEDDETPAAPKTPKSPRKKPAKGTRASAKAKASVLAPATPTEEENEDDDNQEDNQEDEDADVKLETEEADYDPIAALDEQLQSDTAKAEY